MTASVGASATAARPLPRRKRRGVSWGWLLVGCACSSPVATDLEERAANDVLSALQRGGVAATKSASTASEERWTVRVPADDHSLAASLLAREGLPPATRPGVLEVLEDDGLVSSRRSEQVRLLAGTAGDLEQTLRSVDGVLSARVHIALPEVRPLAPSEAPTPGSAAVLVRHRARSAPLDVGAIQRLVAASVSGLDAEDVTVVPQPIVDDPSPPAALAPFGPISTSRQSVPRLRLAVAIVAFLNIGLVTLVLVLWSQLRRSRRLEAPVESRPADRPIGEDSA